MIPAVIQPIQTFIKVFEWVLLRFHDDVGLSWGLSIIALTLVVRAFLFPLTYKQFKSMMAMQQLSPQIRELQKKYADDKQRLQQETMKFYQENKVNPLASCLPLVAQMPVFISLFYMLRKDLKEDICGPALRASGRSVVNTGCDVVDKGSAKFGFIPDLTFHATGGVLILLLALYVGSQLLSSVLMATSQDKNQRLIMAALPFVFVLFVKNFPAGLLVYWITTNFWTVAQGYAMRKTSGWTPPPPVEGGMFGDLFKPKPAAATAAGSTNGKPAKASGDAAPSRSNGGGGRVKTPVKVGSGRTADGGGSGSSRVAPERKGGPPPSARKKKKRSGRRR